MLECQIGDVVIMSAESLSLDENVFDQKEILSLPGREQEDYS